ncbi:MAG TPA: hypothetical protein DEO49_00275 [Sutterella sp.]|nr:hypothetical protein [Sutterella sp.]
MTSTPKQQPKALEEIQDEELEIDLLQLAKSVLKRMKLCVAICGAAIVCGLLYCFLATPIYEANCRILADKDKLDLAQGGKSSLSSRDFITTQVKLMTSEHILTRVFNHFDFGSRPEYQNAKEPLKSFEKKIQVKQQPNTSLIDVTFKDKDAELSARVANYLAQTFVNDAKTRTTNYYDRGLKQLREELRSMEKQRLEAVGKVNDFKTLHNMISVNTEMSLLVDKLKEQQTSLATAKQSVATSQAAVASLESMKKSGLKAGSIPARIQASSRTPAGQAAGSDAETSLIAMQAQLEGTKNLLPQLENEVAETEAKLKSLDKLADEYKVLDDNLKSSEKAYQLVLQNIATLQVQKSAIAGIDTAFQIVVPATKPNKAAHPAKAKIMIIVALAAGVLSVLLCVMLELLDKTLKTRQDFEKTTRLPVFGEIPRVGETSRGHKDFVPCVDPGSAAAESFRSLRTMLSLSAFAREAKLIAVTSAATGEGKSFISLNLAMSCAQTGKRVLLVDSDLRHRSLTEQLCGENSARQGLSSILAGASPCSDLIVKPFDGISLDFMPSGPAAPNPSELLASENTRNTFEDFARSYDIVIVDTAPVLAFSDTPILSAVPSMNFLMVGRLYETEKSQMAEAIKTLRSVNGTLIGTVIELGEKDSPTGSGYSSETAQRNQRPWYKKLLGCA